ncbi:helix-turn-helix transcriptional regulator [Microbacterium aurum]
MPATLSDLFQALAAPFNLVRTRSKLLARSDRRMRAELVEVRRMNNLTQADVAEMMGVSQQAVQKLERYDADPKLSTLRRYANAVGAIVEHRVTRDLGQSESLCQDSQWRGVGQLPRMRDVRVFSFREASSDSVAWSAETKRTDFALSA